MSRRAKLALVALASVALGVGAGLWRDWRSQSPAVEEAAATASTPRQAAVADALVRAPAAPPTLTPTTSTAAPPDLPQLTGESTPPPPDEPSLMARLRELKETDPALSLQLAREGNSRFPDSPDAPERTWIVVKSLVDLTRFDEARAEARSMVAKYPDNPRALDVQRHLLSGPP